MKDQVFERIKRLLALATSSNEEEARVAMAKAQELLVKHNLDMQEVKNRSEYEISEVFCGGKMRSQIYFISQILQSFFFVKVIHVRRVDKTGFKFEYALQVVGSPTNAAVASYVFEFLMAKFPELWKIAKKKYQFKELHRSGYYQGLAHGILYVLDKARWQVQEEKGLVVVKDPHLEKFADDICDGKIRNRAKKDYNKQVMNQGIRDGLEVKIAKPIESKGSDVLLIEGGYL